jgi:pilus assembly protein FimV
VIPPPPAQQKPVVPRPPVTTPPPTAEEPGLPIDSTYLIAGGGLALLGLGAWLIKRRRNAMIAETESILLAAERENIQPSSRVMAPKAAESMLEPVIATKSSFLSEFTPSDFDALGTEADDVDPVSEADVYLAYGRYKQAEELIRHAISQHPERDECKLKLLEIYYATENRSAFENYARELKAAKKDAQPDFWAKVVEMGQEIVPTSSLFQAGGGEPRSHKAPPAPATAAGPRAGLGTLDLSDDLIDDLKRFEIEFVEPSSSAESLEDEDFVSLDFGGSPQTGQDSSADKESLDFDIASLYRDEVKSAAKEAPPTTAELENLISFDFGKTPEKNPAAQPEALFEDMLLDFEKPKAEMPSAAPEPAKKSEDLPSGKFGFDFDLFEPDTGAATDKGLDFAASPSPETHREEPAAAGERPPGKLGFDLELFEPETTGAAEGGPVMAATPTELSAEAADEDMFADLTDMDQFETKLDLAKAYADMEDDDSAREILLEVITAGNERQKAEATALLDKIGGTAQPEFSLAEPRSGRM